MEWLKKMNRTLVESVRSMLGDTKLPHKFWAESLSTAVYLRNRSPCFRRHGTTTLFPGYQSYSETGFKRSLDWSRSVHENRIRKKESSKPVNTPVNPGTKLKTAADDSARVHQVNYQCAVGHLFYLPTKTRPDIAYAVSDVARLNADPAEEHWVAVNRIMRYLNGTRDMGLLYDGSTATNSCIGYSDADWAGDPDDRKSTSRYVFQLSNALISWQRKKQSCVALLTAEAQYMALAWRFQTWRRNKKVEVDKCNGK